MIRFRRIKEYENPEVPVFPGPYNELLVLQQQDENGEWKDVEIVEGE